MELFLPETIEELKGLEVKGVQCNASFHIIIFNGEKMEEFETLTAAYLRGGYTEKTIKEAIKDGVVRIVSVDREENKDGV